MSDGFALATLGMWAKRALEAENRILQLEAERESDIAMLAKAQRQADRLRAELATARLEVVDRHAPEPRETTRVWVTLWEPPPIKGYDGPVRAVASVNPLRLEGCDITRIVLDIPHGIGVASEKPVYVKVEETSDPDEEVMDGSADNDHTD